MATDYFLAELDTGIAVLPADEMIPAVLAMARGVSDGCPHVDTQHGHVAIFHRKTHEPIAFWYFVKGS